VTLASAVPKGRRAHKIMYASMPAPHMSALQQGCNAKVLCRRSFGGVCPHLHDRQIT